MDHGEAIEVAEGGMVDWTHALLDDRTERPMVSGLSLEGLARGAGNRQGA